MGYTISKRPTKKGLAYDLYVRWKGVRYRPLLGYDLTKEQAETAAIAMMAKIQAESITQERPQSERTLRDLLPLFWDSFTVKKRIDRVRPKGILDNYLLPTFGHRSLSSLTPKDGLDYVLKRQQDNAEAKIGRAHV